MELKCEACVHNSVCRKDIEQNKEGTCKEFLSSRIIAQAIRASKEAAVFSAGIAHILELDFKPTEKTQTDTED